jgi:hypothetical protein
MLKSLGTLMTAAALSQILPAAAFGQGCACQGGGGAVTGGYAYGGGAPYVGGGYGGGGMMMGDASFYSGGGSPGAGAEQLYPFDNPEPWQHGYFQEIPAYGGYNYFRPYNYKHVLSQSQVAGGWGMSPTMPYSQEYFRRLREQPAMEQRPAEIGRLTTPRSAAPSRFQALQEGRPLLNDGYGRNQTAPETSMPLLATPRTVDPAMYVPSASSRTEELEARIREQARQLDALQRELHQQYERESGFGASTRR